jgi:hypothetical protein
MSRENLKTSTPNPAILPFTRKTKRQPKKRGVADKGQVVQLDAAKTERAKHTATVFFTVGIAEGQLAEGDMAAVAMMDGSVALAWCGEVFKEDGELTAEFGGVNDEDIDRWIGRIVSVKKD